MQQAAGTVALANQIILTRIFSNLPFNDLKNCRLVNTTWNFEAALYIKNFHPCHAHISKAKPCFNLYDLNELVSGMTVVPINSLKIDIRTPSRWDHSFCQLVLNESKVCSHLLEKVPLKYLYIRSELLFKDLKLCPMIPFVISLLSGKLSELHTLILSGNFTEFLRILGEDWAPSLPKLEVLDADKIAPDSTDFALKIVKGAPSLQKIKTLFYSQDLDAVSEEKYGLLENFILSVHSNRSARRCLKLAEAGPRLFKLASQCSLRQRHQRRFFQILGELLTSSSETLETFTMYDPIFPLVHITFPPLVNLKKLAISTVATIQPVLNLLRSIDYSVQLPALAEVELLLDLHYDNDQDLEQHFDNIQNMPVDQHSCVTVRKLKLSLDWERVAFRGLSLIFPNVINLTDSGPYFDTTSDVPYSSLWAHWPYLEVVYLTAEGALEGSRNYDAEFLGINSEEVRLLREMDEETLEKMNIVPVKPSVLTMPRKIYSDLVLLNQVIEA